MFETRPYQKEAVERMFWNLEEPENSFISIAQGGGKSVVIAEFARKYNKPILILQPNKELLEQNVDKLLKYVPQSEIGIYSASKNSKEINTFTFGTIQSIYKNPEKFKGFGVAIVDEADLIDPQNYDGMYNTLFREAKIKKVFGMSATPFRLAKRYERWGRFRWQTTAVTITKMINRFYPAFFRKMLYVKNIKDLIEEGYLLPLTYHDVSLLSHQELLLNKSRSDFVLPDFEKKVPIDKVAQTITYLPHKKKLVFCSSVKQANYLAEEIPNSVVVTAETDKKTRQKAVEGYKEGKFSTLLGVGIFTAGFDVPDLDCIVMLRPTRSLRLYAQVAGRGTRKAEGKTTCHLYDFVGNVSSLGRIETMEIRKNKNGWNVFTETRPEGWHNEDLYEWTIKSL